MSQSYFSLYPHYIPTGFVQAGEKSTGGECWILKKKRDWPGLNHQKRGLNQQKWWEKCWEILRDSRTSLKKLICGKPGINLQSAILFSLLTYFWLSGRSHLQFSTASGNNTIPWPGFSNLIWQEKYPNIVPSPCIKHPRHGHKYVQFHYNYSFWGVFNVKGGRD